MLNVSFDAPSVVISVCTVCVGVFVEAGTTTHTFLKHSNAVMSKVNSSQPVKMSLSSDYFYLRSQTLGNL